MPELTSDQEKRIGEELIRLGWMETEQGLHSEGVRAIQEVLQCSPEDAKAVLGDLRARKLVDTEVSPGGRFDAQNPMPVTRLRWIRAATPR